jgi:peptidoglycan/LPS O-acetylase OafA/YrhL
MTRHPGLDVLRAISVALVIGHHYNAQPPGAWPEYVRAPFRAWVDGGWAGVQLFFVLSGFLVSGLLFREYEATGAVSVRRFLIRRWWKIYPPFAYLVLVYGLALVVSGEPNVWPRVLAELLFLQNYLPGLWGHTWSLAVEEHFYLLLACTVWWLVHRRCGLAAVPRVVAGVCVAGLGLRVLTWLMRPDFAALSHRTSLNLDGLAIGVGLAYLAYAHPERVARLRRWRAGFLIVGLALVAPVFVADVTHPWFYTGNPTVLSIGASALVLAAISSPTAPAWLVRIGISSYSIYLWHYAVRYWVVPQVGLTPDTTHGYLLLLTVALGCSVLVGMGMERLIERPALQLRDRVWPRLTAGPLLPPAQTLHPRSRRAILSASETGGQIV